ncbi:peroxide stress protein YaaA [Actinomadura scrupuli]|uniref:peroxide stress protein YaaA n=1 Tax=Actinomadura scrupuli TaxID=559629 RepID=UPI003D972246
MLILLPPSEGKAPGGDGPPLDVDALAHPRLGPVRRRVLRALVALCKGPQETARQVLGLSPGQADAVVRNRTLRAAPTLSAADLYTGVLYDNLGLGALDREARERAASSILIFSGLWGALRIDDRVPPYRLAMGVSLPPLGALAAVWRPALSRHLRAEADDRLIVDMRSAPYAAAWRPAGPTVAVRVVRERVAGGVVERSVVSHMAKATRGVIARDLLVSGAEPRSPSQLAKVLSDLGHVVELEEPARADGTWTAGIVVTE